MKPERQFIAARAFAQHCSELLRSGGPDEADVLAALALFAQGFARRLATGLTPVCGDHAPSVQASAPSTITASDLTRDAAPLAANLVLGSATPVLLASIDAVAVLSLVDRAFGGKGIVPEPLPKAFPPSAELMIARLEQAVGASLGDGMQVMRRETDCDASGLFGDGPLARIALTVREQGREPWHVTLVLPFAAVSAISDDREGNRASRAPRAPSDEPFAALPLTLSAVLVDVPIRLSALANLRVGEVLPVPVARSVPLRLGGRAIAHGTVGTLDDCAALQLTQTF